MSNQGMYAQVELAQDAYTTGIEINFGVFRVWITHAGVTNEDYTKTLRRVAGPYWNALQNGSLPQRRQQEILMDAFAQGCVKRWEVNTSEIGHSDPSEQRDIPEDAWAPGVEDRNGDVQTFNAQNVLQAFKDLPTLFWDLYKTSEDLSNYRQAAREGAAKNSSAV